MDTDDRGAQTAARRGRRLAALVSHTVALGLWLSLVAACSREGESSQEQPVELAAEAPDTADAERDYAAYIAAVRAGDDEKAGLYIYEDWQLNPTLRDNEKVQTSFRDGDRVLLVLGGGESSAITNTDGSPARSFGTVRMQLEDGRWKVRRRVWDYNPITDPVEEGKTWMSSKEK